MKCQNVRYVSKVILYVQLCNIWNDVRLMSTGLRDRPKKCVCIALADRISPKRPIGKQNRDTFVVE